ncbi:hypothetical protein LH22_12200 [Pantoea rwandensis]|uniref:Uncharacterized protein n=1 Tax=Pantoea rwandensis TaxID=1076550 RepID=A0ABM5RJR0_9GAMM|nr:hypothetical protein LH22_12200 [Pantoea rwandensis]
MCRLGFIAGRVEPRYQFQAHSSPSQPALLSQDFNGNAAQQRNLAGVGNLAKVTGEPGIFFRW